MCKEQFSQEAVDKVLHCFYVDDCLVSAASEEEAISLPVSVTSSQSVLKVDSILLSGSATGVVFWLKYLKTTEPRI